MEEGLSFNMVLSGATLVSVLGLFVKLWISGRNQKIEQPLEIASQTTSIKQCDERHHRNDREHENIFSRLAALERQGGRVEGEMNKMSGDLSDIKTDIKKLLSRGDKP